MGLKGNVILAAPNTGGVLLILWSGLTPLPTPMMGEIHASFLMWPPRLVSSPVFLLAIS
jgi:hypothetical protein